LGTFENAPISCNYRLLVSTAHGVFCGLCVIAFSPCCFPFIAGPAQGNLERDPLSMANVDHWPDIL
jgi:hypothetical protein